MEGTLDGVDTSKAEKAKRKPKPKKAKKSKAKKAAKRKPAKTKTAASIVRSERLDLRLTKPEKAKINAKASKLRRTVTSLVVEAIEKIK